MSGRTALLQAITREPADDGLRLAYATWLEEHGEPERAELIRVQVEAECQRNGSLEHNRLTDRAVQLLRVHAGRWTAGYAAEPMVAADLLVSKAHFFTDRGISVLKRSQDASQSWQLWFNRGFVDEVAFAPERFFALSPTDIRSDGPQPMLRLVVHNSFHVLESYVERLASAPLLSHFRDVRIRGGFSGTTDAGLRLLANEPSLLAKLGGLCLSEDNLSDQGILPILESPRLGGLRELAIDSTRCTEAVLSVLRRSHRFRKMTYLHLDNVIAGARGLRAFATPGRWPQLRSLHLGWCGLTDLTLRGLMRPEIFPALELLDLVGNDISFGAIRTLLSSGIFPRLRMLGLGGIPLSLDEVQVLRTEFSPRIELHFPVPRAHCRRGENTPPSPAL